MPPPTPSRRQAAAVLIATGLIAAVVVAPIFMVRSVSRAECDRYGSCVNAIALTTGTP